MGCIISRPDPLPEPALAGTWVAYDPATGWFLRLGISPSGSVAYCRLQRPPAVADRYSAHSSPLSGVSLMRVKDDCGSGRHWTKEGFDVAACCMAVRVEIEREARGGYPVALHAQGQRLAKLDGQD